MKNLKRYILIGTGALLLALGVFLPNGDPVLGRIMNPQAVGVAPSVADLDMNGYDLTDVGSATLGTTTTASLNGVIVVDGVHYAQTGAGIQAAIDALPVTGRVELTCPSSGIYELTATINFNGKHGVILEGQTAGQVNKNDCVTLQWATTTGGAMVDVRDADNWTINNILIDGQNYATTGILAGNTSGGHQTRTGMDTVHIRNINGTALDLGSSAPTYGVQDSLYNNVEILENALGVDIYTNEVAFTNCVIGGNTNAGIRANRFSSARFDSCSFTGNNRDILVNGTEGADSGNWVDRYDFVSSWFELSTSTILVSSDQSTTTDMSAWTFIAPIFHTSGSNLLDLTALNGEITVIGARVDSQGASSQVLLPSGMTFTQIAKSTNKISSDFTFSGAGNSVVLSDGDFSLSGYVHGYDVGVTPDDAYNGILRTTRAASTGQHINMTRVGNKAWSIGYAYNTDNFAIGSAQGTDSSFNAPEFVIKNDGYVGINTPTPLSRLAITDGASEYRVGIDADINGANSMGTVYRLTPDGSGFSHAKIVGARDVGLTYTSYLGFYTESKSSGATDTSTEKMRIDRDGNVGIGTTTPRTLLDVYNATATSSAYVYSGGAGLGGRLILEDYDGGGCTAVVALNGVLSAAIVACP